MMVAGQYYVGDLCYVMTDEEWDEFCDLTIKGNRCLGGEFALSDGRIFATYNTKWGDGEYKSNRGTSHCVDSGSIGCILVSDIRANKYDDLEGLGAIIDFNGPFSTGENNGMIYFGELEIETDPEYAYEEYDDDE